MRRCLENGGSGSTFSATDSSMTQVRNSQFKDTGNGQKASVATLFEQGTSCLSYNWNITLSMCMTHIIATVGLQKILSLLESDDANVRIHAVKVVANLAAEGILLPSS